MLPQHHRGGRRRPHSSSLLCALTFSLLLLLSVSVLYSRLLRSSPNPHSHHSLSSSDATISDSLLDDSDPDDLPSSTRSSSDDRIDELDNDDSPADSQQDDDPESEEDDDSFNQSQSRVAGYFFDPVTGAIRRAFDKRSIDQWEDYEGFSTSKFDFDGVRPVFGSDDVAVDEEVRRKAVSVRGVEDALVLRGSPLREGWGKWFDAKSDFLRRDRMFKSNFELLNPLSNPLLQDPDGVGVTGLTKGDKLVMKGLLHEFKKVPFLMKKPLGINESEMKRSKMVEDSLLDPIRNSGGSSDRLSVKIGENRNMKNPFVVKEFTPKLGSKSKPISELNGQANVESKQRETKMVQRRKLDENVSELARGRRVNNASGPSHKRGMNNLDQSSGGSRIVKTNSRIKEQFSGEVYANGKRWGYFPGLHPRLSFSNFMDAFFRKGKCSMRVFMVWNSPPWMFTVRQQRGIESLLLHHRDTCLVVFSETIELNFFEGFVKDGFKVAVAMPNLDELLKDTPTHIFASVWFEWRKARFYSTHYSELVRLAALYKYGGFYLDSDIIVLRPLSSFNNTIGLEDPQTGSSLNGAVMSFRKHSPFIMECLAEFYSTYDEASSRWNGADLLTRVARNYSRNMNVIGDNTELKLQPSSLFFPISRDNITRYFTAPEAEAQRAQEDKLLEKILNESFTFHFWNRLTSALVPEPESLVARIINQHCIHCSDVL